MPLDETRALTAIWRSVATAQSDGQLPCSWTVPGAELRLATGSADADDCAVIDVDGRCSLVLGSDYIRGVKFALYERGLMTPRDLGWYLAVANFSDVAAMGAMP